MKLQPLKTYHAPKYPTQESLRQEPEQLRAVPRRWRGNRAVLSALAGALALMNQSCTTNPDWAWMRGNISVPRAEITEDEANASQAHRKREHDWAPLSGITSTPRSAIPEDEAKAAADQAAKASSPSPR